jgi:hypothetical protein
LQTDVGNVLKQIDRFSVTIFPRDVIWRRKI